MTARSWLVKQQPFSSPSFNKGQPINFFKWSNLYPHFIKIILHYYMYRKKMVISKFYSNLLYKVTQLMNSNAEP